MNVLIDVCPDQSYNMYLKKEERILVPIPGSGPAWMTWLTTSSFLYTRMVLIATYKHSHSES